MEIIKIRYINLKQKYTQLRIHYKSGWIHAIELRGHNHYAQADS